MKHRSPTSNRWADHYTQKARKENYPARSVYKLQEIQRRFQVIKRGNTVLDLGCSPGSWLVYAAELTGAGGAVTGIDLKPVAIRLAPHVKVLRGDVFDLDEEFKRLLGTNFDVLLSDMAPTTTGSRAGVICCGPKSPRRKYSHMPIRSGADRTHAPMRALCSALCGHVSSPCA